MQAAQQGDSNDWSNRLHGTTKTINGMLGVALLSHDELLSFL
jgi:hypothetical protein